MPIDHKNGLGLIQEGVASKTIIRALTLMGKAVIVRRIDLYRCSRVEKTVYLKVLFCDHCMAHLLKARMI